MEAGAHIVVEGLVQGVGFRYFVMRHAVRLGLNGFVQNLYNGEVDIEVEGDRQKLEELLLQVKKGPRSAQVTKVRVEWRDTIHHLISFEVR